MKLDPTTTAIIPVHLVGDIAGAEGAFAQLFHPQIVERNVMPQVRHLLEAARAAGALVLYTRVAWAPDYSDLNANSPLLALAQQAGALIDGTPGAAILDEVAPSDGDVVVTHQRVGCFVDSDLHATLAGRGITTVVVCGVATNASVEATFRTASDLGFRTILAADACSAATPEAHDASAASMALLGEISTVNELLTALRPVTTTAAS